MPLDGTLAALQSLEFQQGALLLILGAALTGVLVPLVKSWMDHSSFRRRTLFEARLARQADVIVAQVDFLKRFSKEIWGFHKMCQRVSYSKVELDDSAFREALDLYRESIWDSLQEIRSQIGQARWFTSETAHAHLLIWYEEWFLGVTMNIEVLIRADAPVNEWSRHHQHVHSEAPDRNFGIIRDLAADFGITPVVASSSGSLRSPTGGANPTEGPPVE